MKLHEARESFDKHRRAIAASVAGVLLVGGGVAVAPEVYEQVVDFQNSLSPADLRMDVDPIGIEDHQDHR